MVTSSFLCPFVISEVVSQRDGSNQSHMLLQSIVLAHAGQYLVTAGTTFFTVAIYLCGNLTAERYIVSQTGSDAQACHSVCHLFFCFLHRCQVSIAQKDFDLTDKHAVVTFLHEMYNLTRELEDLAANFDSAKWQSLGMFTNTAHSLRSLTSQTQKSKSTRVTLASVHEWGPRCGGTQDDLGIFAANDIQLALHMINLKVLFVTVRVSACRFSTTVTLKMHLTTSTSCCSVKYWGCSQQGYLKFVQEGEKEVDI